jgi:PhnB protein
MIVVSVRQAAKFDRVCAQPVINVDGGRPPADEHEYRPIVFGGGVSLLAQAHYRSDRGVRRTGRPDCGGRRRGGQLTTEAATVSGRHRRYDRSRPGRACSPIASSRWMVMTTKLNPYLNFREGTREVMEFYVSVFGGELTVTTFGEAGGMGLDESEHGKVMHSQLVTDGGLTLMASDVPSHMLTGGDVSNGNISLSGDDEAELRGYYDKLSDGGTVTMPMENSPWGDIFGMCVDKFGVDWLVNVTVS